MSRNSEQAQEDTENRRRQLRAWIDTHFNGKQADFVRKHGLNQGEVSGLLGTKSFGSVKARNIEEQTGMPARYLEERRSSVVNLHATPSGSPTEPRQEPEFTGKLPFVKRVPVVGSAKMGDEGWYEEHSDIPGSGDGYVEVFTRDDNAYTLRVRGDSMAPAIRDGWFVVIEPNSAVAAGEYVLVKMTDGRKMVKELLYERPDSVAVMSINGQTRMTLDRSEVAAVQAVAAIVPPSKWKPI